MEASGAAADPFATSAPPADQPPADDPFVTDGPPPASDLEPTTADDVAAEVAAEPAADLPVVDKEGAVVEPPVEEAPAAGLPDTATAAGRAKAAAAQAQPAAEAPQEPQEGAQGAEAAVEAPPAPETQTDGDGGAGDPPADPPAPAETPAPEPSAEKGELRLYKLLYQTGPTTWEEAKLADVADDLKQYVGKDPKDKDNKDGLFIKARNNDHARRLAFSIMGRPADGVTVELVARTSWKPVRLHVAPPEPSRERLVIS